MSFDPTDPRAKELARQQLAERPAVVTRETIDAELRELSDHRIADLASYDAPAEAMPWEQMTPQERRGWRARNELARRRTAAARQAEGDAAAAQVAARQQAAGAAQRATIRAQMAAASPGLGGVALDAAVDAVLTARAIAGMDRLLEQKRGQIGGL